MKYIPHIYHTHRQYTSLKQKPSVTNNCRILNTGSGSNTEVLKIETRTKRSKIMNQSSRNIKENKDGGKKKKKWKDKKIWIVSPYIYIVSAFQMPRGQIGPTSSISSAVSFLPSNILQAQLSQQSDMKVMQEL